MRAAITLLRLPNAQPVTVLVLELAKKDFAWAHGVVVSRLLRMQKALGSNPSGSSFIFSRSSIQERHITNFLYSCSDTVSEWLRSWTRNPMGFARMGSNPIGVVLFS